MERKEARAGYKAGGREKSEEADGKAAEADEDRGGLLQRQVKDGIRISPHWFAAR